MLIQDSKSEKLASEKLQEDQKHQQHDDFDPDEQHAYLKSAIKEQDKLNGSQLDQILIQRFKLLCIKSKDQLVICILSVLTQ